MTVVRAIYITGCKEKWGPTVIVDPGEPENIGKSFSKSPPVCHIEDNHLDSDIKLKSIVTGKLIYDSSKRATAVVKIICDEKRCPLHNNYLLNNDDRLHPDPYTFVDSDVRKLRPEVIDFIISDAEFLESTTIGYRLNQLVTSYKMVKTEAATNPLMKKYLLDKERWIFRDNPSN